MHIVFLTRSWLKLGVRLPVFGLELLGEGDKGHMVSHLLVLHVGAGFLSKAGGNPPGH